MVAGGFVFDERYLGKPLVFCGTGGILPARVRGAALAGTRGRARRPRGDGRRPHRQGRHPRRHLLLRGAERSSSPTSAVQIGDPITQKKVCDFLLEARDLGPVPGHDRQRRRRPLLVARRDGDAQRRRAHRPRPLPAEVPGARAVGDPALRVAGADDPRRAARDASTAFLALARRRDVEATVARRVHRGRLRGGDLAAAGAWRSCDLAFLHDGLPTDGAALGVGRARTRRGSAAAAGGPRSPCRSRRAPTSPPRCCASPRRPQRPLARGVGAAVRPRGAGPLRGEAVRRRAARRARATARCCACGPTPGSASPSPTASRRATATATRTTWPSAPSTRRCAATSPWAAIPTGWPRSTTSAGPTRWRRPDNPDGAYKLAQLVRACRGLADACARLRAAAHLGQGLDEERRPGRRAAHLGPAHAARVAAWGSSPTCAASLTTDFKRPGDAVWLVGETRGELGGTRLRAARRGSALGACPSPTRLGRVDAARIVASTARRGGGSSASCHDLSDGGLWVALAESALGGGLGAEVSLDAVPADRPLSVEQLLFGETPGGSS